MCEDRGGSDPEAVSGAPHFLGSYLGPGGCGRHRKVCGYVPGPFETRSAASGTKRLLFGMPRESITANSPHSSVSHRFLKLPVSETVQCSDKNRKADGTNEVSLITMTGGNTDSVFKMLIPSSLATRLKKESIAVHGGFRSGSVTRFSLG